MLNSKIFDEIEEKILSIMPESVKTLRQELKKNIHAALQSTFAKMQLVTREEFDQQTATLNRARDKLIMLEQQVKELEEKVRK